MDMSQKAGNQMIYSTFNQKFMNSSTDANTKFKVAIIDRTHPSGQLADKRWEPIEEQLLQALIGEIENSDMDDIFTAYNGFKWEKGIKVIECDSQKAVQFLQNSLRNLGPLTANIEVVPSDTVLDRSTVWLTIPPPLLEKDAILQLLRGQNKALLSADWTIDRAYEKDGGIKIHLEVSLASEDLIKKSNNCLRFGLNHLKVIYPTKQRTESSRWS